MEHKYFPRCTVDGPIDPPVSYGHFGSFGAIPNKCRSCSNLFEGECVRAMDSGGYKHLDHGPCGVMGPTDPVHYEDEFVVAKVRIPRKCASCNFLRLRPIHGFVCTKDESIWGDFHRGLDWGDWIPSSVFRRLPYPKGTNDTMLKLVADGDLMKFISEHRRINPGVGVLEAKEDFEFLRDDLDRTD